MSRIQMMFRPWTSPQGVQMTPGFVDRDAYPDIPEDRFWDKFPIPVWASELKRLKALIKEGEFGGSLNDGHRPRCPWCEEPAGVGDWHAVDCAAFTPDGSVR